MEKYPYMYLAEASWSVGADPYSEWDQDYYYDGCCGASSEPAFVCSGGNTLAGGGAYGTISTTASTSAASCNSTMSASAINEKSMRITFSGQSQASIGTADAAAVASTYIETWGWIILMFENNSSSDYELWYNYDFSATSQWNAPWPGGYSARFTLGYDIQANCDLLGLPDHYSYTEGFQIDGDIPGVTSLQREEYLINIPPGTTFVQLYAAIRSSASSSTKYGNNYSTSNTFSGSVLLELKP